MNQAMKVEGPLHVVCQCDKCKAESQEPVVKLQEPTVERAWFTIAELNAWADKKLSENPHWVMPKEEHERNEPPPQRTWVGLTDEEVNQLYTQIQEQVDKHWTDGGTSMMFPTTLYKAFEAKLRSKNT